MRGGNKGMTDWSSYGNSYLRLLDSSLKAGNTTTIYTLSVAEQQLVSEAIRIFVKHMSSIGVKITTTTTSGNDGTTKYSLSVSKEMFS